MSTTFNWSSYPNTVTYYDITVGVSVIQPVKGTYTCTDGTGHTITGTGPPE